MPDTLMFRLPSSLNLMNAADAAFGGIAGAFQKHAKPLPMALSGSFEVSFLPQSISFATRSMASTSPLGFIFAPYASVSPSTIAFLRLNATGSMPIFFAMRVMCDSRPNMNSE